MMLLHRTGRTDNSVNFDMSKGMDASGGVLDSFWSSDNGLPTTSFPPSAYLHDKDTAYDMFLDSQSGAGSADWSRDLSSFSDQVHRASAQDLFPTMPAALPLTTDPYYCSAPALAPDVSSPWNLGGSVGDATSSGALANEAADPAFSASLGLDAQKKRKVSAPEKEDTASSALASPTAMPTSRSKRKASSAARPQPKRASSRSSSSALSPAKSSSVSDSGSSSGRLGPSHSRISGHGGNHRITLRTASRKPKPPAIKTEGHGSYRQGSGKQPQQQLSPGNPSPLSPDGSGNYGNSNDNLTSEERRARQNHNVVEKQYRNRLNSQFEKLLAILPANERDGPASTTASSRNSGNGNGKSSGGGGGGAAVVCDDRRMSKAEVLELARRRIHALEQERLQLRAERQNLLDSATAMQEAAQNQQRAMASSL